MNKPEWAPEHGVLLESLRIQAGMDLATMARRNMLSPLQVKQLEKGGSSGFYNASIKFSAGQKLLKFFGHELKIETVTESNKALPIELIEPSNQQPEAATSNFKPYLLGLAFIVMAILILGFFQSNEAPITTFNTSQNVENKLAPPETEKISAQPMSAVSDSQAAAEKPAVAATATPEKVEASQLPTAICQWEAQEIELQANSPRKRGEYVHVVAVENATVCIKDGDQRVASLSLASGQARSIYGPPPFKVYSPNLGLVKLYFQGEYIKLPSEDTRQIKLSPVSPP